MDLDELVLRASRLASRTADALRCSAAVEANEAPGSTGPRAWDPSVLGEVSLSPCLLHPYPGEAFTAASSGTKVRGRDVWTDAPETTMSRPPEHAAAVAPGLEALSGGAGHFLAHGGACSRSASANTCTAAPSSSLAYWRGSSVLAHADYAATAEALVFGSAAAPLRALFCSRTVGSQQRLVRGSLAVVRDGPDAYGVPSDVICRMVGAAELWSAASETDAMPSALAAAAVALCDLAARAVATHRQPDQPGASAEELLPCIGYSMAMAVATDAAPCLVASLRLATAHLPRCGVSSREGYCITTLEVAMSAVQRQGSRPPTPPAGLGGGGLSPLVGASLVCGH